MIGSFNSSIHAICDYAFTQPLGNAGDNRSIDNTNSFGSLSSPITSYGRSRYSEYTSTGSYRNRGFGALIAFFIERHERFSNAPRLTYEPYIIKGTEHPCSEISLFLGQNGFIVALKIVNEGRSPANDCSGRIDFERVVGSQGKELMTESILKNGTLNWSHFEIEQTDVDIARQIGFLTLGPTLQRYYPTKRNQDLIPKEPEYLEICFTIKGRDFVYATMTSREPTLKMGETYRLTLQMVGRELNEKPRFYMLDLKSWDKPDLMPCSELISFST